METMTRQALEARPTGSTLNVSVDRELRRGEKSGLYQAVEDQMYIIRDILEDVRPFQMDKDDCLVMFGICRDLGHILDKMRTVERNTYERSGDA